jgi:signal transduction protein with GAF and PtsI domain
MPMVGNMRDAYRREGIASMIVFPLLIRGEPCGTMVFYSRRPCEYREVDVQVGTALANLAAASLTTAELYDEQRKGREAADQARQQAAFLAEAGTVLSSSLDYETTLTAVTRLAVPAIADWCAVNIVGEAARFSGWLLRMWIHGKSNLRAHCRSDTQLIRTRLVAYTK